MAIFRGDPLRGGGANAGGVGTNRDSRRIAGYRSMTWQTKWLNYFSGLKSCNVAGIDIQLSDKVKILGATLDSNLTMEPHTKALSSSCFYHIRSFKQIRLSLDDGMAISVASALVSSRLDQVNSILYGAASKHINRLQRVQNALARVVTYQHPYTSPFSSTALL